MTDNKKKIQNHHLKLLLSHKHTHKPPVSFSISLYLLISLLKVYFVNKRWTNLYDFCSYICRIYEIKIYILEKLIKKTHTTHLFYLFDWFSFLISQSFQTLNRLLLNILLVFLRVTDGYDGRNLDFRFKLDRLDATADVSKQWIMWTLTRIFLHSHFHAFINLSTRIPFTPNSSHTLI